MVDVQEIKCGCVHLYTCEKRFKDMYRRVFRQMNVRTYARTYLPGLHACVCVCLCVSVWVCVWVGGYRYKHKKDMCMLILYNISIYIYIYIYLYIHIHIRIHIHNVRTYIHACMHT